MKTGKKVAPFEAQRQLLLTNAVIEAIEATNNNVTAAPEVLGLSRNTVRAAWAAAGHSIKLELAA